MFNCYARVSKSDDSQVLDLQIDALVESGVEDKNIYQDKSSGKRDNRPGLVLNTVHDLAVREIGFKVLIRPRCGDRYYHGQWETSIQYFAALAEFERDLIIERTKAVLAAARARRRKGGRKF